MYTVLDRPKGTDGFEPCYYLHTAIPSGWSLRGRVPVDDLRFEHHERVLYVTRGSLERSLSAGAGCERVAVGARRTNGESSSGVPEERFIFESGSRSARGVPA